MIRRLNGMKRFKVINSSQECDFGDTLELTLKDSSSIFGNGITTTKFVLNEDNYEDLLSMGILDIKDKEGFLVQKFTDLLSSEYSDDVLLELYAKNRIAYMTLLLNVISKYYLEDANVSNLKGWYMINLFNGKIYQIKNDYISPTGNFTECYPIFKDIENANTAVSVCNKIMASLYGSKSCSK